MVRSQIKIKCKKDVEHRMTGTVEIYKEHNTHAILCLLLW